VLRIMVAIARINVCTQPRRKDLGYQNVGQETQIVSLFIPIMDKIELAKLND
jgi:hypothetical protein